MRKELKDLKPGTRLAPAGALLAGAMSGFRNVTITAPTIPRGVKKDANGFSEGQAARQRRQGLHSRIVHGFQILQTLPSRDRIK